MTITLLCFAQFREFWGRDQIEVVLPPKATAHEAFQGLLRSLGAGPELSKLPLRYAVNGEFASEETILREGDELAPLPPVSGG